MASSLMDIKLHPYTSRIKQWLYDNCFYHPVFAKLYHEKYKAKDEIWMRVNEVEVKEKLDDLTRKFKGQFTMYDFLHDNKFQIALSSLSLPVLITGNYLVNNLQRIVSMRGAYSGFLAGYSKLALANVATFGIANTYLKGQNHQYFGFMTNFMGLSLLLAPIQLSALKDVFRSYAPLSYTKQAQILQRSYQLTAIIPYVMYQMAFGSSMYLYNKDQNTLGHLSLFVGALTGTVLVNDVKQCMNPQMFKNYFATSFKTLAAFMALNILVPMHLGKLKPRSYYRDQYYETLSEGVGYLTEKESEFVQIIFKNLQKLIFKKNTKIIYKRQIQFLILQFFKPFFKYL